MANISDSFIVCCLFLLYYIFLSIYIKNLVYGFYKNKINESPYTAEAFMTTAGNVRHVVYVRSVNAVASVFFSR